MKQFVTIIIGITLAFQTTFFAQITKSDFFSSKERVTNQNNNLRINGKILNNEEFRSTLQKNVVSPDGDGLSKMLFEKWENGAWVNFTQALYTLDGNGNATEWLNQKWENGAWVNNSKSNPVYDGNNKMTEDVSQKWENGAWVNNSKTNYTYDGNVNETEQVSQSWDNGSWVNVSKWNYTYDSNNNQTEWFWLYWIESEWVNESKYSYTYDSNNNETEWLWENWDGSSWVGFMRNFYTFDSNNRMTEENNQMWFGNEWMDLSRTNYTYDSNGLETEEITQVWLNFIGPWTNSGKANYTYDGNNLIEEILQNWVDSEWVNTDKLIYTNNPEGFVSSLLWQIWENSTWVNDTRWTYDYDGAVWVENIDEIPSEFKLSQNYPNPFNPETRISYTISKTDYVELKIYDLLGNDIATLVNETQSAGSYEVSIDASNFASGTYFYILKSGNNTLAKKCVLLK